MARRLFRDIDKLKVTLSSTGRVRHVYREDKLIFTLRMEDGYLLPTLKGAELLDQSVTVSKDAAPFIRKGKSVMAKSIVQVSPDILPGLEVAVRTEEGDIIAVGRLLLSADEIMTVRRGVAVKVRDFAYQQFRESSSEQ